MSDLDNKIAELKLAKPTLIAGADRQEVTEGDACFWWNLWGFMAFG